MFRDIELGDKAAFLEMAERFYSSTAVAHSIGSDLLEAMFDAAMSGSPFVRALIIEDDGATVGFAVLSFSFATEVGGLVVLLEDLYIDETCRGNGVGSSFMQFLEQEYPAAKRFRLEVTEGNKKAIDLYKKLGYRTLSYVQMVRDP